MKLVLHRREGGIPRSASAEAPISRLLEPRLAAQRPFPVPRTEGAKHRPTDLTVETRRCTSKGGTAKVPPLCLPFIRNLPRDASGSGQRERLSSFAL